MPRLLILNPGEFCRHDIQIVAVSTSFGIADI
jgi:hypothetical protein